jgi:hypothetical protein
VNGGRLPADVRLLIDRQVTRDAVARTTTPPEHQIAEAVDLATEWYTLAQQHDIDHDTLGLVGSLATIAVDAIVLRDRPRYGEPGGR